MTTLMTGPDRLPGGITDEALRAMTAEERRALARRLVRLTATGPTRGQRRMFVLAVGSACAALVGWMFELGRTLPTRYLVGHWDAAWIGFDGMLLIALAAVGWSAWRGLEVFSALSVATAVLLVCDAWFDVTTATAGADTVASILLAAFVELPLAACLTYLAHRRYVLSRGNDA